MKIFNNPFFKKFTFYSFGLIIAKSLSMLTQILIGKSEGPEFYGEMTMILVIANYISIPMVNGWGLAYVRLVSIKKEQAYKVAISALKMLIIVSLPITLLTIILILANKSWFVNLVNINEKMLFQAIIIALATTWWLLAKQIFQSLQKWYHYTAVELLSAIILLTLFLLIFFEKNTINLEKITSIFVISYLISGSIAIPYLLISLFSKSEWYYAKEIMQHGIFLTFNTLIGTLTFSLDRVLINGFLSASDVGIYQAHFLATYGLISTFNTILINYLFPLFSQKNKLQDHQSFKILIQYAYPSIIGISMVSGTTLIWLYGYPISWGLLWTLSLFNAVNFHGQLYAWLFAGQGTTKTRQLIIVQAIQLVSNIIFLIILLPLIKLEAGGISLLGGAFIFLFFIKRSKD